MADKRSETAIIHFYRGELGRMAIYRVRLDTTTNWAIGVSVAVTTFALGTPDAPHVIMLLPYVLTAVFMFVEARRFQELEVYRGRIRAIEMGYFAPQLTGQPEPDGWGDQVAASLREPDYEVALMPAVRNRVRRNYLWLFLALYGAWVMKLSLIDPAIHPAAGFGSVPGWVVLVLATLSLVPWFVLGMKPHQARRA